MVSDGIQNYKNLTPLFFILNCRHKSYLEKFQVELAKTDASSRKTEAEKRQDWEASKNEDSPNGKSAFSRRMNQGKPDLLTSSIVDPDSIAAMANDKTSFQQTMNGESPPNKAPGVASAEATARVSKIIATAGSGEAFEGQTLGVGGLDDVLLQVKRRIWTPLAAPPQLLKGKHNLGICTLL